MKITKKIMKRICFSILTLILFVSCASRYGNNPGFRGGRNVTGVEGWKNNNQYVIVISGQWDRKRYYIEESKNADTDGKEAKPGIILEQISKRAAKEQAKRDFLEKVVGSFLEAKTGTKNSKLIDDVIQSGVSGTIPSPISTQERYTKNHDARITFMFQSKNLKDKINKAVDKIIKKQIK